MAEFHDRIAVHPASKGGALLKVLRDEIINAVRMMFTEMVLGPGT